MRQPRIHSPRKPNMAAKGPSIRMQLYVQKTVMEMIMTLAPGKARSQKISRKGFVMISMALYRLIRSRAVELPIFSPVDFESSSRVLKVSMESIKKYSFKMSNNNDGKNKKNSISISDSNKHFVSTST